VLIGHPVADLVELAGDPYSAEDWQRTMCRHDRLMARGVLVLRFTPPVRSHSPVDLRASVATSRSLLAGTSAEHCK
jgi:hypothetical protein